MTSWLGVILTVALISSCVATNAQTGGKGGRLSKVAPELTMLYDEYSSYLASRRARAFQPADPLVRVIDDRVVVDAVASVDANVLKSDLVSLGMQQAVSFGRVVSGQLPISAIPAMAGLPSLKFARAAAVTLERSRDPLSPGIPSR
jgi:hypothetical protein